MSIKVLHALLQREIALKIENWDIFHSVCHILCPEFLQFTTPSDVCFIQMGSNDFCQNYPGKLCTDIISYVKYLRDGMGVRTVMRWKLTSSDFNIWTNNQAIHLCHTDFIQHHLLVCQHKFSIDLMLWSSLQKETLLGQS